MESRRDCIHQPGIAHHATPGIAGIRFANPHGVVSARRMVRRFPARTEPRRGSFSLPGRTRRSAMRNPGLWDATPSAYQTRSRSPAKRIPTGFRRSARGCAPRYPGNRRNRIHQPPRGCVLGRRRGDSRHGRNPVGVRFPSPVGPGVARRATPGSGTQRLRRIRQGPESREAIRFVIFVLVYVRGRKKPVAMRPSPFMR